MLAADILRALHHSVPSLVLFRLGALRPLVDDDAMRRMLGLPGEVDVGALTHVALTGFGPLVAGGDGRVVHTLLGAPPAVPQAQSLLAHYWPLLTTLPATEPDCLGVGQLDGHDAVALHVSVDGADAHGVAAFARRPSGRDYDLLRAVGVEYLGGEEHDGGLYLAHFRNRLDQHLLAGRLAGFGRTDHCNRFFLGNGEIDEPIARGLGEAASARIADGLRRVRTAVASVAAQAIVQPLALTCVAPPPAAPAPYGDLVALGFVLAALRQSPEMRSAADALARHLLARRRNGLWSYHSAGLPTATDTALVMQGFDDGDPVALEAFRTQDGGYVPQLWAASRQPLAMQATPATHHWCQPDFATTALVAGLRRGAGLPIDASVGWLANRFDRRGGLFFANPLLTDWALSCALGGDALPHAMLRDRLRSEIVASVRDDHAFGAYDQPLSTALAILSLANLGERGRVVRLAQVRLLEWIDDDGRLPPATPFYSSLQLHDEPDAGATQIVRVGGRRHAITFYRDDARIMTTALAALALAVPAGDGAPPAGGEPSHPRYGCRDPLSYVAGFALAPYLEQQDAAPAPGSPARARSA